MNIKTNLNLLNANLPSVDEIITFYSSHEFQVSEVEASEEIRKRTLVYQRVFETYNSIEDLILNTNIINHDIAFFRFHQKMDLKYHLLEFATFLECDPVYLNKDTNEVWVQRPGYYYLDFPDEIIKGFSNPESFIESLVIMELALRNKMYRNKIVDENIFQELLRKNDKECLEFLEYFFLNIKNFE